MKRLLLVLCLILMMFYQLPSYALSGFSIAQGHGEPNNLRGGRASLVWNWHRSWLKDKPVNITGFWDVSVAYWSTDGNSQGLYKGITTFAAAPVFRLIPSPRYNWPITPFLELGVGVAMHTNDRLGKRNLGSNFAFQDLLGFGFALGRKRDLLISYHYLHYSNANIWRPNQGVDVKYLFQMMYLFG